MSTREELTELLPEWCYAENPHSGEPVIIRRFESGYEPVTLDIWPAESNGLMGVTREQELAMLAGSMFGWDKPGADPRTYYGVRE